MRKHFLIWLIFSAALWSVLPIQAQAGWYAFLFNGITRQLLRVDANGTQETFDLGLDETVFLGSRDIAFSPDGSRAAYCINRASGDTPQGDTTLIVRDLAAQTNALEVPLGGSLGCRVSTQGFNADATQVAVSIIRYFSGDTTMDTSGPAWRLLVVDVASGSTIAEINAQSESALAAGVLVDTALLPEVRQFADNQVIFAEVPWGVGGAPEWRAFIWQLGDGIVQPDTTLRWGKSGLSYLASSGELAWVDNDPDLPSIDPGGPIAPFNVVKLADSAGAEQVLYHTAEWVLVDTEFINGGTQLGVLQLAAFDAENPNAQQSRWIALNRDGTQAELTSGTAFTQIADAPGGYALFEFSFSEDFSQQTFRLTYVTPGETRALWEAQEPGWELAGTIGAPLAADLPAFVPVG
jgi:hypothetical protein